MSTNPTAKVALFAKFTTQPGKRDEVLDAFEAFLPTAEAEQGTEVYAFHRDEADEDALWIYELYTDHAALGAHASSPEFAALVGEIGGLFEGAPMMHTARAAFAKGLEL